MSRVFLITYMLVGGVYLFCQPLPIQVRSGHSVVDILPLPIVFYDPYTDFGFGGLVGVSFKLRDSTNRFSSVRAYAAYTLKNQFLSSLKHYIYTPQQSFLLKGEIYYRNFVEDLYERGALSQEESARTVAYHLFGLEQHFLKRISMSDWFVGASYLYEDYSDVSDITDGDMPSFLEAEVFPNHARRSNIGLSVVYDSRDNINSTHTGTYISLGANGDIKWLGASQELLELSIDARSFLSLKKGAANSPVLAGRFYSRLVLGDAVPYLFLSRVGERSTSRGIREGRYRSEWFSSFEAAYRFSLFPASTHWLLRGIRMNLFATINMLNNQANEFSSFAFLPTVGLGFRYEISRQSRQMLRGDLAVGSQSNKGVYVNVNEAF